MTPLLVAGLLILTIPGAKPDEILRSTTRLRNLEVECQQRWEACHPRPWIEIDSDEWKEVRARHAEVRAEFVPRLLEIATEDPLPFLRVEALVQLLLIEEQPLTPEGAMALQILRLEYAADPTIGSHLAGLASRPWEGVEWLLDDVIERNPDPTMRVRALWAKAQRISRLAGVAIHRRQPRLVRADREFYGEDQWNRLIHRDIPAQLAEARAVFERLSREEPRSFPLLDLSPMGRMLAREANVWIHDHDAPSIDFPAPEIEGPTVQGPRLRLTDQRGKVVLLVFWSSRVPGSVKVFRQAQQLVRNLNGLPFTVLGVQCESATDQIVTRLIPDSLGALSWLDRESGPIAGRYGVKDLPASFLIDDEGILAVKRSGGKGVTLEEVWNLATLQHERLAAGPPRP